MSARYGRAEVVYCLARKRVTVIVCITFKLRGFRFESPERVGAGVGERAYVRHCNERSARYGANLARKLARGRRTVHRHTVALVDIYSVKTLRLTAVHAKRVFAVVFYSIRMLCGHRFKRNIPAVICIGVANANAHK